MSSVATNRFLYKRRELITLIGAVGRDFDLRCDGVRGIEQARSIAWRDAGHLAGVGSVLRWRAEQEEFGVATAPPDSPHFNKFSLMIGYSAMSRCAPAGS